MIIGSWNVRGMGGEAKKAEVATFFSKFNLDFCCIQESKLELLPENEGRQVWRDKEIKWTIEAAVGRSGGLISYWDERRLVCVSTWNIGGAVIFNGLWKATREEVCVINIYAPCNRAKRR